MHFYPLPLILNQYPQISEDSKPNKNILIVSDKRMLKITIKFLYSKNHKQSQNTNKNCEKKFGDLHYQQRIITSNIYLYLPIYLMNH